MERVERIFNRVTQYKNSLSKCGKFLQNQKFANRKKSAKHQTLYDCKSTQTHVGNEHF